MFPASRPPRTSPTTPTTSTILVEENQSASLFLVLDGSGANRFRAGDDTYSFTLTPGDVAPVNHTTRHATEASGAPMPGGALATRTAGGIPIEARIPRTGLGQGFGWTGGTTNGFSTAGTAGETSWAST